MSTTFLFAKWKSSSMILNRMVIFAIYSRSSYVNDSSRVIILLHRRQSYKPECKTRCFFPFVSYHLRLLMFLAAVGSQIRHGYPNSTFRRVGFCFVFSMKLCRFFWLYFCGRYHVLIPRQVVAYANSKLFCLFHKCTSYAMFCIGIVNCFPLCY